MFPALIPLLIGAGTGALFNKKDPMKGALMGAAVGGIGGGMMNGAKGLLGAVPDMAMGVKPAEALATNAANVSSVLGAPQGFFGSQVGAGMASSPGILSGASGASSAMAPIVEKSASAGLFDKMNIASNGYLDKGMQMAKPLGQAMQNSQMMQGKDEPPPVPPPTMPATGPAGLAQLAQQGPQVNAQQQQYDAMQRQKRREMIARMGLLGRTA